MAFRLPRLPRDVGIVEASGRVTLTFQRWWQSVVEKIETQEGLQDTVIADLTATQADLAATQADLTAAVADIAAAQADINAAQTAITTIEGDLLLYVLADQTLAWATPTGTLARTTFAAYAGQTVSNPPTQAEVQAIDDHVKVLSQRLAALIADLRGNGVLT